MLVLNKKSGLVRLSDAVKTGLGTCSDTSAEVLQCFSKDESLYRAAEKIFDEALGGRVDLKEAHSKFARRSDLSETQATLPIYKQNFITRLSQRC